MKIVKERPPNFDAITTVFPVILKQKGVLYCWDDKIYNPDGVDVSEPLMCHEKVHYRQQGGKPDLWWQQYLTNSMFRFEQELEAHRVEYGTFYRLNTGNRNARRVYLTSISERLAGPLYGKCVTPTKAKKLIKEHQE